jgi:nucleotide-binding universal stress UspA family protein
MEVSTMKVQKILVPIDFSDHSQQALQWGAELAEKYGAQILLLTVLPKAVEEVFTEAPTWEDIPAYYNEGMSRSTHSHYTDPIIIDLVDSAQTRLDDLAHAALKDTVTGRARVAVGKPPDEILRVAQEEGVDLIVMGTHGRTGLRHVLLGSVAETVVRAAPCPVFTVRDGAPVLP